MPPTLIILHGWSQSSSDWITIQEMLKKDCPVIALDLPGFGGERLISENWTIPEYADWTISKINDIPGDKIILGHSFGGRIASYIASSNPSWLKGLILSGAPCIYRPSIKIKTKIFLAKILKNLGLKKLFKIKNTELHKADTDGLGKIFRNAVSFDQTEKISKINIPTLLVWGEYDKVVPLSIGKEIQGLIPKSKLIIIDRVGHNAHKENAYLFYATIKNFLKNF